MAQNDSHDQGQQEFTGCINLRLMLRVIAPDEAAAMEMLAKIDLETVLDEAPFYDPVMDSEGRYFFISPEPLPAPLDELDAAIRADVERALCEGCEGGDA